MVITDKQFFANANKYIKAAYNGEKVVVKNGNFIYQIAPVEDDGLTITPELQAKLDKARAEIKKGNCITLKSHADIDAYLDSL